MRDRGQHGRNSSRAVPIPPLHTSALIAHTSGV